MNKQNMDLKFMGNQIVIDYTNNEIKFTSNRIEDLTPETIIAIDKIKDKIIYGLTKDNAPDDADVSDSTIKNAESMMLRFILIELLFNGYLYKSITPVSDAISKYSNSGLEQLDEIINRG